MSTDLMSIKNVLASIETGLDADSLAVGGAAKQGNKRISIKGGVFRKFNGGKEVAAIEDRHMNVIFVKMAHEPSRMFYTGAYEEGARISPVCWSTESKVPDEDVVTPQSSSCDTCQFSAKGSASNGKSSACRLSWRTAVVLPNDPAGDVLQLVIPGGSIWGDEDAGRWPFKSYVRMLTNNNISAGRVITKMQFDTKSPAPKLLFSPSAGVPSADLPTVLQQSKSQPAEYAVKLSVFIPKEEPLAIAAPAASTAPVVEGEAPEAEPVLRKAEENATPDTADLVKRWAKK